MALEHALNSAIVLVVIVFLFIAMALIFAIFWLRRRKGSRFEAWLRYLPLGHQFWSAIHDAPSVLLRDVTLLVSTTLLQILIIALDAATLWIVLAAWARAPPLRHVLCGLHPRLDHRRCRADPARARLLRGRPRQPALDHRQRAGGGLRRHHPAPRPHLLGADAAGSLDRTLGDPGRGRLEGRPEQGIRGAKRLRRRAARSAGPCRGRRRIRRSR